MTMPVIVRLDLDNVDIPLVEIPPGEFPMGSDNELYSEMPRHRVVITGPLWMGRCSSSG